MFSRPLAARDRVGVKPCPVVFDAERQPSVAVAQGHAGRRVRAGVLGGVLQCFGAAEEHGRLDQLRTPSEPAVLDDDGHDTGAGQRL